MHNDSKPYILKPNGFFGWNSTLRNQHNHISLNFVAAREMGNICINDEETYLVAKDSPFRGEWKLMANNILLASATKLSFFTRDFDIRFENQLYHLAPISILSRSFYVSSADQTLMIISPNHYFTKKASIEWDESLALPLLSFSCWLTLMCWRRKADNTAP